MKRCPECRRDYYDETLLYCLDDGTALLAGPASVDEQGPSNEPASESPTRAQIHTTDQTVILPTGTGTRSRELPEGSGITGNRGIKSVAALLAVVLILSGGYFGYRYVGSGTKPIASIAVMPFVNASGNADVEYLSDGMTETLINNLSQLPAVSVKARSAVFRYKGKDLDPRQVATELNAEAVLNGRVVQRGDTITLSLDLVDAATGNQIWGEQYSRNVSDLVMLQKEIARDVSNKLSAKLTGADERNLAKSYTVNPEAYQLYLQGRYQWNRRTSEGVTKSREYFQQAIDKDPQYALAYVGLADSYVVINDLPPVQRNPKAKAAALKALELDPSLGEAHAVLGNAAFFYDWDWPTAEREYRRSIELSPNYATAHHWFGESLSAVGRFDESFAEYRRATELDPVSPAISSDLGWAYFNSRQFDRAVENLTKLIDLDPGFVRSYFYLATVYEETGRFAESIEIRRTGLLKSDPDAPRVEAAIARLRSAHAESGEAGYWKAALELMKEAAKRDGQPTPPMDMASLYAKLNDRDHAFESLEQAFRERQSGLVFLTVEPTWDSLRDDPRFADLVGRVGVMRK